ncbi:MAG: FMN-binding protein [Gammaproteobacteria bacterium]|nr:FMN-binding protein [Gammaproteobacteria bacterium]
MTTVKTTLHANAGWPMYRTLVGIGLICALVIVTVFEVTFPIIKVNKQRALENAIYQVLANTKSFSAYHLVGNNNLQKVTDNDTSDIYACYDANHSLIGFAIAAQGMGYQDTIALLYGYSIRSESIQGLVVLQSRETPGLGSKIESRAFLDNFNNIEIGLDAIDNERQQPLELIKNNSKTHTRQIDAITGATISSRAVVVILNRSLSFWLPIVAKQQEPIT